MVDLERSFLQEKFAILLADDQKFMLKNLERYFATFFNVATAATLEEAKIQLQQQTIGVVVSDHQMAGGQGIALLEFIRDTYPEVRRILITADRHEQVVIDMMRSEMAHSFVFKPTVKVQLHQALAEQSEIYLKQT